MKLSSVPICRSPESSRSNYLGQVLVINKFENEIISTTASKVKDNIGPNY